MGDGRDCKQSKLISPRMVQGEIDEGDEMIAGGQAEL